MQNDHGTNGEAHRVNELPGVRVDYTLAVTVTGNDMSNGQPMALAVPRAVPTEKNALPVEGHVAEEIENPSGPFMMRARPAPFVSVLRWQQSRKEATSEAHMEEAIILAHPIHLHSCSTR